MDQLTSKLDQLSYFNKAELSKSELRFLLGAKRLGKNYWKTVFDYLPDGIDVSQITVYENGDQVILMRSANIKTPSDLTE